MLVYQIDWRADRCSKPMRRDRSFRRGKRSRLARPDSRVMTLFGAGWRREPGWPSRASPQLEQAT
jgi:hypothetical protein